MDNKSHPQKSLEIENVKFSVLMSVYRRTNPIFLDEALKSIWDHQHLKPSQIVLIQDGPISKETDQVLLRWNKRLGTKFTLFRFEVNNGLASALNKGLTLCRYELVARMDDDDISLPGRFRQQIKYFLSHPNIGVLGTQVEERDQSLKRVLAYRKVPISNKDILSFSKKRSPVNHPSVMFKKSIVLSVGGYPSLYPEDWPLWGLLLSRQVIFSNLSETQVIMRAQDAISNRRGLKFLIGEVSSLTFLFNCGHLSFFEFSKCLIIRAIVRLSPIKIRTFLYKHFR